MSNIDPSLSLTFKNLKDALNPVQFTQFTVKTVCIVKFNNPSLPDRTPGRFYMVTVDPSKLSPTTNFIRFGDNPGDELLGWQQTDWITVLEILGEWPDDGTPPTLEYSSAGSVSILAPPEVTAAVALPPIQLGT